MRYMVVETFTHGAAPVYRRFAHQGRMLPKGLVFVESWIDASLGRCWQVMETDDPTLLEQWTACWDDLVSFEIVPLVTSAEAAGQALAEK
ncbi:MAG: DUF3303 domain-containing protein [Gaiella sp.]